MVLVYCWCCVVGTAVVHVRLLWVLLLLLCCVIDIAAVVVVFVLLVLRLPL